MRKYTNFFSSPKSEIAKDILEILVLGGVIALASTSPYFIYNLLKCFRRLNKYKNKRVYDTFYQLRRQGLVAFDNKKGQIFISLTEKGRKKAGWMKIDDLKIKSQKWDGKWRILLFDIAELKRIYREALRGKLKDLNFKLFQKSAWITPYNCSKEIKILKEFFGLSGKEAKLIISDDIGDDREFRKYFKL